MADHLLQCVLWNRLFQTFTESRSIDQEMRVIVENKWFLFVMKHGVHTHVNES